MEEQNGFHQSHSTTTCNLVFSHFFVCFFWKKDCRLMLFTQTLINFGSAYCFWFSSAWESTMEVSKFRKFHIEQSMFSSWLYLSNYLDLTLLANRRHMLGMRVVCCEILLTLLSLFNLKVPQYSSHSFTPFYICQSNTNYMKNVPM